MTGQSTPLPKVYLKETPSVGNRGQRKLLEHSESNQFCLSRQELRCSADWFWECVQSRWGPVSYAPPTAWASADRTNGSAACLTETKADPGACEAVGSGEQRAGAEKVPKNILSRHWDNMHGVCVCVCVRVSYSAEKIQPSWWTESHTSWNIFFSFLPALPTSFHSYPESTWGKSMYSFLLKDT